VGFVFHVVIYIGRYIRIGVLGPAAGEAQLCCGGLGEG
jgi:hypothetical protein